MPGAPGLPRVLVVTNDFPPRLGGVQQYVWNLVRRLPADRMAVLAPAWEGWRAFDGEQPFPVHRWPASFLLPTRDLARRARQVARTHQSEVVLFGHGFPLPLLAPSLEGRPYIVLTHGAEVWLARTLGPAGAMRRALRGAAAVTAVSEATRRTIASLLGPDREVTVLYPGVDERRFSPDVDGSATRERLGVAERQVVLCVSRLVRRKGQDTLIAGLPLLRSIRPRAALVLAGDGPERGRLDELARSADGDVVFAGAVPDEELPALYAAADLFAMPCRSRWGGLEVEGFGIVFLEAAAAGKPVVAGRSGGAGEAVKDEVTGLLVEGREPKAVALAASRLLSDPDELARMGAAGRARVEEAFTWDRQAERLAGLLQGAAASPAAAGSEGPR